MAAYQCFILIFVIGIQSAYTRDIDHTDDSKPTDIPMLKLIKEVEDNSRYKTLEANATVLKLLVDDKDGVSQTEVFDMLHSKDDNEEHMDLPTFPEDTEDAKADVSSTLPDSQTEFLQGKPVKKDCHRGTYNFYRPPVNSAAVIMIGITTGIVVFAYLFIIVWRKIYLKRNGLKHELLRNEEFVAETRIEVLNKLYNNNMKLTNIHSTTSVA